MCKVNRRVKSEIQESSLLLTIINFVMPVIVLVFLASLVAVLITQNIDFYIEEKAQYREEKVISGFFLGDKQAELEQVTGTYVIYYDKKGKRLNELALDEEDYFSNLDYSAVEDDSFYRTKEARYYVAKVELDLPQELKAVYPDYSYAVVLTKSFIESQWLKDLILGLMVVVIALAIIISIFSFLITKMQIKPYKSAVYRNMQLVSDVSHEFNTPLAIINTTLSTVLEKTDSSVADVSDKLIAAMNEIKRLKKMVSDMLLLSRSDANRLPLEFKQFNLSEDMIELVEPFEIMCSLQSKEFKADIDSGIVITSDEDKIKQCVIVMLDNACKYTKAGESISFVIKKHLNKIRFTVSDTGKGVTDGNYQKVFQRFYREDSSRTTSTGGTGLGLSIVKAISQALGGKVLVGPNKPKGFKITFEIEYRLN